MLVLTLGMCSLFMGFAHGANFETAEPFYGQKYADIALPRGLYVDDAGDLLVISQGSILALTESENSDGTSTIKQTTIVERSATLRINHGITYHNSFLYASSTTNIFRWPYRPGQQTIITAPAEIVVKNIPSGGHDTRTLLINSQGMLYVSIGSLENVDDNSDRSRIRTFNLNQSIPTGGIDFIFGGVYADGLRHEVGIAFDVNGILWGVENGADELDHPEFGDIHNGNPAEELNRLDKPVGTHYGYPYCFSTYDLEGFDPGTQFVWPKFIGDGIHTDAWCRNTTNNQPPALAMPAHWAPLGIEFYDGRGCDEVDGAFPCSATGDALVAFHGSWNSDIKVGYRVGWIKFENGEPTGENADVIFEPNTQCNNCFRPVNAVFNKNGHLIVSSDESSELFQVTYNTPPRPISK